MFLMKPLKKETAPGFKVVGKNPAGERVAIMGGDGKYPLSPAMKVNDAIKTVDFLKKEFPKALPGCKVSFKAVPARKI
jgi:hypothetical protein